MAKLRGVSSQRLVTPGRRCYDFVRIRKFLRNKEGSYEEHRSGLPIDDTADIAPARAAAPTLSHDGQTMSLSAENQTFGQVMALFQRHMGLEIDIPGDLNGLKLPLVEVKNLSMREALLKVLEGSNYDYILVAVPGQPDRVRKLVVPAKSAKVSAAATAFRSTNRPLEDPFGGGVETSFEDNSNAQPEPVAGGPILNPPVQNPPAESCNSESCSPRPHTRSAGSSAWSAACSGQPQPTHWRGSSTGAAASPSALQSLRQSKQPPIAVLG